MTPLIINRQTLQKKIKTPQTHKKNLNFYANALCTYLPLPANAQAHPKGKVKRVKSPYALFRNLQTVFL